MPDPTVWPFDANGEETVVEGYGFLTDIIRSDAGMEQRNRLRIIPLETIEFSILEEGRAAQLAHSIIYGTHAEAMAVPLWQFGSRLSGAVAIGATLLPIADAQQVPYRRSTDNAGYALVWKDPFNWELFEITGTPGASGVATVDTATRAWAAGEALVYPAHLARLSERQGVRWLTSQVLVGRLQFTMEQV